MRLGIKTWGVVGLTLSILLLLLFFYGPGSIKARLASPGPLSKAHFVLNKKQNNCSACHKPFQINVVKSCINCHDTKYFKDKGTKTSSLFHLQVNLKRTNCLICHQEHKGSQVTKKTAISPHHLFTKEELKNCSQCHKTEENYHLKEKKEYFGKDCSSCHTLSSWKEVTFNHDRLTFTALVNCLNCHDIKNVKHGILPGTQNGCLYCHTTTTWKPQGDVKIIVRYDQKACTICHSQTVNSKHAKDYGTNCNRCHSQLHWKVLNYQHTKADLKNCSVCHKKPETTLHQPITIDCKNCHNPKSWYQTTFKHELLSKEVLQKNCSTCHYDKSVIHRQNYGQDCAKCHNTSSWGKQLFNHTKYTQNCQKCHQAPPSRSHNDVKLECQQCHTSSGKSWYQVKFKHALLTNKNYKNECYNCHMASFINHRLDYLRKINCAECHKETDWKKTNFSHQTTKKKCVECHYPPDFSYHKNLSNRCELCHNTVSWKPALFDHIQFMPLPPGAGTKCTNCHVP
ncbi:cytochrome c3 family protein [Carboxydothermus islandicus]|uniref:cytochrome c3 family protein n=1 Tax=Carboxydothermus islandicus TaxID=661089 RepID=UPI00096A7F6F|nr:cytochrome c3 family protein [Carboxydothermus islandicus]